MNIEKAKAKLDNMRKKSLELSNMIRQLSTVENETIKYSQQGNSVGDAVVALDHVLTRFCNIAKAEMDSLNGQEKDNASAS